MKNDVKSKLPIIGRSEFKSEDNSTLKSFAVIYKGRKLWITPSDFTTEQVKLLSKEISVDFKKEDVDVVVRYKDKGRLLAFKPAFDEDVTEF